MLTPFELPFVQRGMEEVLLLSIAAGVLGTWIVLRGLAFYSHAVASASFPGLVLASGLGFSATAGAFGTAALFALLVALPRRRRDESFDALTALVLVGAIAIGVILASDVFHSGSDVENLLFGSLLAIQPRDLVVAGAASALALGATLTVGPRWLAIGFDREAARAGGVRSPLPDALLLVLVAFATVAVVSAVGALLAGALIVVPAATTRLWIRRMPGWQLASVALAAAEGVGGLWLSVQTNAPPGATVAVLGGSVFALSAVLAAVGPRRRRQVAMGAAAVAATAVLGGCAQTSASSKPTAVATTTQLGDIVRTVGGSEIAVHQILQPNTDPHEYEPRPRDVTATANAKVVFESGDNLDHWMGKVVSSSGGSPRVVDLGATAPVKLPGESSGPQASRYDPHWWHDPRNVEAAVTHVRDTLSAVDPSARATFARNASAYLAQLRRLDSGIQSCFAAAPPSERKLVTSHDAFNYFAHRYGVRVVGAIIPSQSTQAQPSAGDIAKLSAQVRREKVKAIFLESSINPKLAKAVARQTGVIANLTLYGDTLGPKGSRGATYVSMEAANADAMLRGFSGGSTGCHIAGIP